MAAMSIPPLYIHSLTSTFLYSYRFGIGGGKRQNASFLCLNPSHFVSGPSLDRLMGHDHKYDIQSDWREDLEQFNYYCSWILWKPST